MDLSFLCKFEFVGLLANWMENSKKTKEFDFQLSIFFGFDIFTVQPNLIIKSIASRLCASIMGLLLKVLGMMEVLTVNQHEFLKLT